MDFNLVGRVLIPNLLTPLRRAKQTKSYRLKLLLWFLPTASTTLGLTQGLTQVLLSALWGFEVTQPQNQRKYTSMMADHTENCQKSALGGFEGQKTLCGDFLPFFLSSFHFHFLGGTFFFPQGWWVVVFPCGRLPPPEIPTLPPNEEFLSSWFWPICQGTITTGGRA